MNKKLIILMLCPAFYVYSNTNLAEDKIAQEREEWTKQHFAKQGAPIPDGGIIVLPENQMSEYHTFKKQRTKERADVAKYGYIKHFLPQTQSLLNFKKVSKNEFSKPDNPTNQGLYHNINELEMAYAFKGVPSDLVKTIGFAPSVTFVEGKGWAGAIQFFQKKNLGTCSYQENNLNFSHGSAIIAQEDMTRDINDKVTVTVITGESNVGFMYEVDWYDENYFHELQCARNDFSENIMTNMLELARAIDNNT